ncbi:MAG: hypothetical protein IJM32_05575 [Ruminococcus sp.]|nr:hypothetical protein [Ruminococcus sp.]
MDLRESFGIAADNYRKSISERFKWLPLFAVFVILSLLATLIKGWIANGADILGGKATVQRYFTANLVRFIIMCVLVAAFAVVIAKTWKGWKSSSEQLIITVCTALILVIFTISALLPVMSISKELKSPRTIEMNGYTLCTDSKGKQYVAFNDDGAVLLAIPADKYAQLQKGNASNKKNVGQAYELVVDGGYSNIQYYESDITVTYYNKSIIYEKVTLKT